MVEARPRGVKCLNFDFWRQLMSEDTDLCPQVGRPKLGRRLVCLLDRVIVDFTARKGTFVTRSRVAA